MTWFRDFAAIATGLALLSGSLVIVLNDRRWMLVMLAGEYVALTWLAANSIPIETALVKLVAGMMVCAILALSVMKNGSERDSIEKEGIPTGVVFRVIAVLLVIAAAWGIATRGWVSMPQGLSRSAILGSILLLGLGLLHLGISEDSFRVGLGLLTSLAGFEILYVSVEPSLSILALLAAVHIGISIIVSYLVIEANEQKVEGPR